MAKTQNVGALTAAAGALAAVGLLVVLMLVVGTRPAEATFPGPNGKIAYTADDGEFPGGIDSEIYTIAPTGGMAFQVTDNDTWDYNPSYSPDGTKIAYTCHGVQEAGIYNDPEICTIKATGGTPFQVTNNTEDDTDPDYSPDGKKIAYVSIEPEVWGAAKEIYTINVGGGSKTKVTNDDTDNGSPSYSPNGNRIAYHSYDGTDWEIYTINVGGGGKTKITSTNAKDEFDPDYSPDGKKIAFSGSSITNPTGTGYEIYTISVGGGGRTRVTNNDMGDSHPSWGRRP
jgi:TolB protein